MSATTKAREGRGFIKARIDENQKETVEVESQGDALVFIYRSDAARLIRASQPEARNLSEATAAVVRVILAR